ncbi:MAG: dihydropteroate synthase [Terriglobales bacterium]
MRPSYSWSLGSRTLELGPRTLVMGVLNVTPDSFSDGGRYFEPGAAIERGLWLLDDGADILDIGGESTRPGALAGAAPAVSAEEELRRILPVIAAIKSARPESTISVDTYKARVAREALGAGAEIVNDISGMGWDPEMARVLSESHCGVVLMHTRGRPQEWRTLPAIEDPLATVKRELSEMAARAMAAGIARERVMLDPGFGFGKVMEQNYPLMAGFEEFAELGFPLLAGVSRKSFVRKLSGRASAVESLAGSLAAATICALKGAHMVRAHDVRETLEAMRVVDAIGNLKF